MFRRPIPRRAFVAAALGALYAFLLLPVPGPWRVAAINLEGVAWLLLAVGLLFLRPLSYYAYMTWALLWSVWKGVAAYQAGSWMMALDVVVPALSAILLTSSGYLEDARAAREAEEQAGG